MVALRLDTSKMSWNKYRMFTGDYKCAGVIAKITDQAYFDKLKRGLYEFKNKADIVIINSSGDSYFANVQFITRHDVVNNKRLSGTTANNTYINMVLRGADTDWANPSDYQIYILY